MSLYLGGTLLADSLIERMRALFVRLFGSITSSLFRVAEAQLVWSLVFPVCAVLFFVTSFIGHPTIMSALNPFDEKTLLHIKGHIDRISTFFLGAAITAGFNLFGEWARQHGSRHEHGNSTGQHA
jgi:hypothetical protein